MKKISFFLEGFHNNICFDLNDKNINRDNYAYSHYYLKVLFSRSNIDLSTYDINPINNSDAVIYNDMPSLLPSKEYIHKSYLLLFESELIRPDNWDLDKHKYFNKIFTWDDRIVDNKKYFKINFSHLFPKSINKNLLDRTQFCTLIAGNKKVSHPLELYSKRIEAIKWFEKNSLNDFNFYGISWEKYAFSNKYLNFLFNKTKLTKIFKPHFPSYKGKVDSKKMTLEKYKFAICYENAKNIDGYITEKIFDCFFAGCIPIYWGANNITDHISKECFIDKRNFDSYEKLYSYLINMSENEYADYLNNIEVFLLSDKSNQFKSEYFAEKIVKTILNDIS